jgi:AcrR family transcriptional regulator
MPATARTPLRRDAAANRERVLAAAEQVFAEQGLEASVDAVIAAAGVGAGTFYRRFADKDSLIDELVVSIGERVLHAARTAMTEEPPGLGLERFLREVGRELQTHHALLRRLWTGDPRPEQVAAIRDAIADLLAAAQESGEVQPGLVPSDISMALWAVSGVIETSSSVEPAAWERHLDLVLAGMRGAPVSYRRKPLTRTQLEQITRAGADRER